MCILTFTISRRNNNIDRVCSEKVICLDKGGIYKDFEILQENWESKK